MYFFVDFKIGEAWESMVMILRFHVVLSSRLLGRAQVISY